MDHINSFGKGLTPVKRPQSIVHRIGRMSSSISLPFGKKSAKTFTKNSKKDKKIKKKCTRKSTKIVKKEETTLTLAESSHSAALTSETVDEFGSLCHSDEDFSEGTMGGENLDQSTHHEEEDFFVALNQNEFLIECFMTNECSDQTFIVHFYAEDSPSLSYDIEEAILIRTMESGSNCQCRRVNSRLTPLFTAKLGIDPDQPTIVAIRNGVVVDRISDISPGCWELEKWISDTGILTQKPDNNSAFPSMNVHSC
ncbi:unnamed protein product [Cylindrotheca closterium]|uniref:Uncharacterized protein n=1 Tax=Cylindrotheca closterium TaxID=2856 RepID=A0AAD2JND6_9STRA|nr:unnamed protein product [Cylindrotheca closterium]